MTEKKPAAKKTKNSAFMAPVHITKELADIVGAGPMPRTEITQKLWAYIKKHNLQDKNNKRMINPDEKLKKILHKPTDMFKMTSEVSKHIKEAAKA